MKRATVIAMSMSLLLNASAVEYTANVSLNSDVSCDVLKLGSECNLDLNGHNLTYSGDAAGLVFSSGARITNSSATTSTVSITSSSRITTQFKSVTFSGNLALYVNAQTGDNAGFQGVSNTHTGGTTLENFNDSNDAKRARFNTQSPFGTGPLTLINSNLRSTYNTDASWTLANSEVIIRGTGNYLANDNKELCLTKFTMEDGAELEIAGNQGIQLKQCDVTIGQNTKIYMHSGKYLHIPQADYSGMELQLGTVLDTVYFWGDGEMHLGALSTADSVTESGSYKLLPSIEGEHVLEIGALNRDTIFYGNIGKDTGRWNLTKVGTGTMTLAGVNANNGMTTLKSGVLKLVGSGSIESTSSIAFQGGTLSYGDGVTTDYSGKVIGATEWIAVDTGTNTITWSNGQLTRNNPEVKGITKTGSGELYFSSYDDLVLEILKQTHYTNRVENGTLTFRNSRRGQRPDIKSKILGTGTFKLVDFEDQGSFRLRGNGAFEDFEGVLDWAETIDQNSSVGFMITDNVNIEWPNVKVRVTGNPVAPACVMVGETAWNPASAHVTLGAFDLLHPNAMIRMDRSAWTLNILGTAGDSYINGGFTNNAVTINKTGAGKLTIGPGFSAPEGSQVNINAGVFALDAGVTHAQYSPILTIAPGVMLAGAGVFGAVDLSVNDVVVPDAATFTDKTATYPILTATSFSGTSANVTALLSTLNASEKSGRWRVRAVSNGTGAYTLTIAYAKSGFIIVLK